MKSIEEDAIEILEQDLEDTNKESEQELQEQNQQIEDNTVELIEEQENTETKLSEEQENKEEIGQNNIEIESIQKADETDSIQEVVEVEKLETQNEQETLKEEKEEEVKTDKKLSKYAIIIAIISTILIIAVIIFSTIFALLNKNSTKIVSGVTIKGIDVSGLTKEEAKTKINNSIMPILEQNIILQHNEYKTEIMPKQIEANFGIEEAINLAYNVGRDGNIIKDNYTIINTYLSKININPSFSYNQKILEDFIAGITDNLTDKVIQSSHFVENNNLLVSKGSKGYAVQNEDLKNTIINKIANLKQENIIEMPVIEVEPEAIDIEKIRNEIYKEPKDAYYTKEPFTVYPHVNGVDINMSVEEAKNLVTNSTENDITIPLKITVPKITTNQIGTEAFPNLLATFSTKFSASNTNRTTNIKLATAKINGVVLMPGETFSYNQVVGKRTVSAGFKEAHIFANGQVLDGVGGGICQVSSTLYNTVLLSNLDIVERSNHSFNTGYVKLGTDATVSWGGPDFKFKNSRKYPIKIVGRVNGGTVTIDIYGLKEENEYEVVIESQILQRNARPVTYRKTTGLATGKQKVVQSGYDGYKTRTYKILKQNGSVVSKTLLSTDTYRTLPKIIEIGQ